MRIGVAGNPGFGRKVCVGLLCLYSILHVLPTVCDASSTGGSGNSTMACAGYLPLPCGRADLAPQAEASLPFTVGAQGYTNFPYNTLYIDPDFGERTVRVTDATTLSTCFGSNAQNTSLTGNSDADVNAFSYDGNYLAVRDENSNKWLMSWNGSTMQVGCLRWGSTQPYTMPLNEGSWGRNSADPHEYFGVAYGGNANAYKFYKSDVSQYATGPAPTLIVDTSTCTGSSWIASLPTKAFGYYSPFGIDSADNRMSVGLGPIQNEGWISVFYDNTDGNCLTMDWRTGAYTGTIASGTLTGVNEFAWDSTGTTYPAPPTASPTTGGSLTSGDTIAIQFSAVMISAENGTGESAPSSIQLVTLSGSNNALTWTTPAASANEYMTFSHINVYACDRTASPGCTPTLQPAANMGCSQTVPAAPTVTATGSGSTTYAYAVLAVGPTCTTVSPIATVTNASTLSGSSYNTVTGQTSVSGAYHYFIVKGAPGSSSIWTNGTATVDQTTYPAQIDDGTSGTLSIQDSGVVPLLTAIGTMSVTPGTNWIPTPNVPYTNSGTVTLTSLSTTGPTPPTIGTLGQWQHFQSLSLNGNTLAWGTEFVSGCIYHWQIGSSTPYCIVAAGVTTVENPPNSYTVDVGHVAYGYNTEVNAGPGIPTNVNYVNTVRPYSNLKSGNYTGVNPQCTISITAACMAATNLPAEDPVCGSNSQIDQHQSWNNDHSTNDLLVPFIVSGDNAGGGTCQTPVSVRRGWQREVYALNPVSGFAYRFAHHRSATTFTYLASCSVSPNCENAFDHTSNAAASQNGSFALFTSDMEWLLGCDPTSTCTYNASGQVITGKSRADVFVVELK